MTERSLGGALAARAAALGGVRATGYAQANRLYTVKLTRAAGLPGFDRATGQDVPAALTTIYEGPARITPLRPSQVIDLSGSPSEWGAVRVSIGVNDLDPRIDDDIEIGDDDKGREARIAGKHFRVTGVTEGGQMPLGYSLDAVGVQPSMFTPNAV